MDFEQVECLSLGIPLVQDEGYFVFVFFRICILLRGRGKRVMSVAEL